MGSSLADVAYILQRAFVSPKDYFADDRGAWILIDGVGCRRRSASWLFPRQRDLPICFTPQYRRQFSILCNFILNPNTRRCLCRSLSASLLGFAQDMAQSVCAENISHQLRTTVCHFGVLKAQKLTVPVNGASLYHRDGSIGSGPSTGSLILTSSTNHH